MGAGTTTTTTTTTERTDTMRDPETGAFVSDDCQPVDVGQAIIDHLYADHGTWVGYYTTSNHYTLTPGQIRNEAVNDHDRAHRQPATWAGWTRGTYHTHGNF